MSSAIQVIGKAHEDVISEVVGLVETARVPGRHAVLLLRHAERGDITDGTVGVQVDLNEGGKATSKRLGEALRRFSLSPSLLLASPFIRTINTLQLICEGAAWDEEKIVPDFALLGYGTWCSDAKKAGQLIGQVGPLNVVNRALKANHREGAHAEPVPEGFYSIEEGFARFLAFVKGKLQEVKKSGSSLGLMVTHDTIIAPFYAVAFQLPELTEETWPVFLEPVLVYQDGEGEDAPLFIKWRGHAVPLSLP